LDDSKLSNFDLSELIDRHQIEALVAGLAHAQDRRDWAAMATLFAPRVDLDLSSVFGGKPVVTSADELAQMAQAALEGFDVTHHAATNLLTRVNGDNANARAHVYSYHQLAMEPGVTDYCLMRGFWEFDLTKAGGRWLICRWAVVRVGPWDGDPDLYGVAAARRK
jgi:SnoaL-like protein